MTRRTKDLLWTLGRFVAQGIIGTVILIGVAIGLSGPSQEERRLTAQNVEKLVAESRKNREVLCLAVIRNPANAASADPRILELCEEIGVRP